MTQIFLLVGIICSTASLVFLYLAAKSDKLDIQIAVLIGIPILVSNITMYAAMYKLDDTYFDTYIPLLKSIDHDKTKVISENGDVKEIYITVNGEEYHFEIKEVK